MPRGKASKALMVSDGCPACRVAVGGRVAGQLGLTWRFGLTETKN